MIVSKTEELANNTSLTKGLTLLLAIAGGISLANIYYNQPLFPDIAKTFHTTSGAAGFKNKLIINVKISFLFSFKSPRGTKKNNPDAYPNWVVEDF